VDRVNRRRWATILGLLALGCMTLGASVASMPVRPVLVVAAVAFALGIGGTVLPPKVAQPDNGEEAPGPSTVD
jgi:hypothetical protein